MRTVALSRLAYEKLLYIRLIDDLYAKSAVTIVDLYT